MYFCDDCGEIIEYPDKVFEDPSPVGVSLASGYYVTYICPYCGSESVIDAGECEICKEPCDPNERFCPECSELADGVVEIAKQYTERLFKNKDIKSVEDVFIAIMERELD